jgi:hypothetical protein
MGKVQDRSDFEHSVGERHHLHAASAVTVSHELLMPLPLQEFA